MCYYGGSFSTQLQINNYMKEIQNEKVVNPFYCL